LGLNVRKRRQLELLQPLGALPERNGNLRSWVLGEIRVLMRYEALDFVDFLKSALGYFCDPLWMALVQSDGGRSVMGIPGQIGLSLSYVIDPSNPKLRAMTWNCYDASARPVTLRRFTIIRPIPQRIMVAVSYTNVSTVRPLSPRPKRPS
jgi:hypothetical protein